MVSLVVGAIGLCVAFLIVLLTRKDQLHARHGLGWVLVAACFALLGIAPGLIDRVANFFGVAYPPILAVVLAISMLVIKILLMDIERSRLEIRYQRLVQRLAMLEADLTKLTPEEAAKAPVDIEPAPVKEKLLSR